MYSTLLHCEVRTREWHHIAMPGTEAAIQTTAVLNGQLLLPPARMKMA